ncbi:MAG: hypothetical protein V9E94_07835 [Microthrixaceae bacterium]
MTQAPVYYNDVHDFWALSRFEDIDRALRSHETFISGKGGILELIKAGIEMPPGILIFEDPPTHTVHRRLLSRVFTPKRVAELEPKVRDFCVAVPRSVRRVRTSSTSSPTSAPRCR